MPESITTTPPIHQQGSGQLKTARCGINRCTNLKCVGIAGKSLLKRPIWRCIGYPRLHNSRIKGNVGAATLHDDATQGVWRIGKQDKPQYVIPSEGRIVVVRHCHVSRQTDIEGLVIDGAGKGNANTRGHPAGYHIKSALCAGLSAGLERSRVGVVLWSAGVLRLGQVGQISSLQNFKT